MRILQAQHGEIAALVLEHDLGFELALVGKRHLHLVGAFDDVDVGDDQAGAVDDHAGAERALHLRAAAARHTEKLAKDRVVEQRVAGLHRLGGIDIDHRRRDVLHHRRIRQPQFVDGRHAPLLRGGGRKARGGDGGQKNRGQSGLGVHGVDSRTMAEI